MPEHDLPHESPRWMTVPLMMLAIPTVLVGFWGSPLPATASRRFLEGSRSIPRRTSTLAVAASARCWRSPASAGLGDVRRAQSGDRAVRAAVLYGLLVRRYYIDELYMWLIDKLVIGVALGAGDVRPPASSTAWSTASARLRRCAGRRAARGSRRAACRTTAWCCSAGWWSSWSSPWCCRCSAFGALIHDPATCEVRAALKVMDGLTPRVGCESRAVAAAGRRASSLLLLAAERGGDHARAGARLVIERRSRSSLSAWLFVGFDRSARRAYQFETRMHWLRHRLDSAATTASASTASACRWSLLNALLASWRVLVSWTHRAPRRSCTSACS